MGKGLKRKFQWLFRLSLIGQGVGLVCAVIFYRLFGHALVRKIYEGDSLPFLTTIIQGQSQYDVEHYLIAMDLWMEKVLVLAVLLWFGQGLGYLFWRYPHSEKKEHTTSNTSRLSPSRLFLFRIFLVIFPWLLLLVPYTIFYYSYFLNTLIDHHGIKNSFYQQPRFPRLTPEEIVQLGWAHREHIHPLNSYVKFEPNKPAGTIRIGLFGDSYVEGEETALEHDISSFLQKHLAKAGLYKVEVINFGMGGYGMHQAYLMWEYLGKRYELDYTIIMPFSFHFRRDNTFLFDEKTFGPLHARFIIEHDHLQLVPVRGNSRVEASQQYYRLLPPWRYIRYDSRIPVFWRAILPFGSPYMRSNPFYYWQSEEPEILMTYRLLFERIAQESQNLIILTNDEVMADYLAAFLPNDRLYILRSQIREQAYKLSTLYSAPRFHRSALGNEFYAVELATLLLDRETLELKVIDIIDELIHQEEIETSSIESLAQATIVNLAIFDQPVAEFVQRSSQDAGWSLSEEVLFREEGIESMVFVVKNNGIIFIPLSFRLPDGAPVILQLKGDKKEKRIPLGYIRTSNGIIGQMVLEFDQNGPTLPGQRRGTYQLAETFYFYQVSAEEVWEIEEATLLIDGKHALQGTIAPHYFSFLPEFLRSILVGRKVSKVDISFTPMIADYIGFRGKAGQYIDLTALPADTGTIDLAIQDTKGKKYRFPIFSFALRTLQKPQGGSFLSPLELN